MVHQAQLQQQLLQVRPISMAMLCYVLQSLVLCAASIIVF